MNYLVFIMRSKPCLNFQALVVTFSRNFLCSITRWRLQNVSELLSS